MAITELRNDTELRYYLAHFTRKWKGVVLHHSWKPTAEQYQGIKTIEGVRQYHIKTNKWRDIGYAFAVGPDGKLFSGRSLDIDQSHALAELPHCLDGTGFRSPNKDSIGIMCCIDGDTEVPTQAMADTLRWWNRVFMEWNGPVTHWEHRRFQPKTCPGRNLWGFDWRIAMPDTNEPSPWAKEAWDKFTLAGIVDGTRPHDQVTREELVVIINRALEHYSGGGES